MSRIPTKLQNPTGLHQRYHIEKIVEVEGSRTVDTIAVDPRAEYYVMRLDMGGSDLEHVKACRIGIHAYADAIQHKLPELAEDLRRYYPLF